MKHNHSNSPAFRAWLDQLASILHCRVEDEDQAFGYYDDHFTPEEAAAEIDPQLEPFKQQSA